jgi:hypothetical protein
MTEENQNNEETHSDTSPGGHDASEKITQIETLESNLRLLRWGMFFGLFVILLFGLNAIYNTSKKAIEPAMGMYDEGKEVYKGVESKVKDAQSEFTRLQPKVEQAYGILNKLADSDSGPTQKLRRELQSRLDKEIKPAAEQLADTVLTGLRGDAMKQLADITENADDIMWAARDEYHALTNSLPDRVTEAIEETLVKMIRKREDRMREMFPKLTKEKQAAVVSRFSELSEDQGQEIFGTIFADHLNELGDLKAAMDTIYDKEAGAVTGKTSVESTIALLSAVLDIATSEFGTATPKDKKPEETKPKSEVEPETVEPTPEEANPSKDQ